MPSPRTRFTVALVVIAVALGLVGCGPSGGPAGTPTPTGTAAVTATPDRNAQAAALVDRMNDADLVGQVLMPSINMDDPAPDSVALLRQYRLGGVILMGNVENTAASGTAEQVRALTDALRTAAHAVGQPLEPILATDQEYGWVTRIRSGIVQLPSAMAFGAAGQPDLTRTAWQGAGAELAAAGINVDFAPDADVVDSAGNTTIGSRSFGSDPKAVSQQVSAAVTGLQSAGVAATLKHFPGHGHTSANSHDELPVIKSDLASVNASDLPPFQAGIDAGVSLVMSGHLDFEALDPGVPASFSSKVMIDLLRTKLGFTGVTITDALNMKPAMQWAAGEAAVRAFLAGNDILLMPPDLGAARDGLLTALASGRVPRSRLVEAVTRITVLKLRLSDYPRPALGQLDTPEHRAAALAVNQAAVTVLKGPCSGPLLTGPVRVTTAAGREQQGGWLSAALKAQGVNVVASGGQLIHLVGNLDATGDLARDAALTVGMDTPFLLGAAPSPVRVATYSATESAMQAVAAVIAGKAKAPGRAPVPVAGLPSSACGGA